jgi:tetratricopeptide (TPR) repeat protein
MRSNRFQASIGSVVLAVLLILVGVSGCSSSGTEPLHGPLMVAGFDNATGKEAFAFWDPWLSDMMIRDLWQADSPVVWPLVRSLRVRGAATDASRAAVLEAGRSAGAGMVLFGRVAGDGEGLLLTAELIPTDGSQPPESLEERVASPEELPAAVDRLRDALWSTLAVSPPAERRGITELTTANLEAYGAFVAGEVLLYQQRDLAALEQFQRAADLDLEFAQAHYRRSTSRFSYLLAGDGQARSWLMLAWAKRGNAGDRDRLAIEGLRALVFGEPKNALGFYEELGARFPGDRELAYYRGLTAGRLSDTTGAQAAFAEAVNIDPRWTPGLLALAHTRLMAGDREEALAMASQGLEVNPADPSLLEVASILDLYLGHLDAAEELLESGLNGRSEPRLELLQGNLLVLQGDLEGAMDRYAKVGSPLSMAITDVYRGRINAALYRLSNLTDLQLVGGHNGFAAVSIWFTAMLLEANGNPDLSFEQLTKAIPLAPDFPDTMASLGVLAAHEGETTRAAQALASVRAWGEERDERLWLRQALLVEGELALAEGDHARAVAVLTEARALAGLRLLGGGLISDVPLMADALARAYLDQGDLQAARREFTAIAEMQGDRLFWPWIWISAHVHLAELAAREGRMDEAQGWASIVRGYWEQAAGQNQPLVDRSIERLQIALPES